MSHHLCGCIGRWGQQQQAKQQQAQLQQARQRDGAAHQLVRGYYIPVLLS